MSQQQEGASSTSTLKSGNATSTNTTGTFAYLQPYARSEFSPLLCISTQTKPSNSQWLREERPCSRSPRSVSPSLTLRPSPPNKSLDIPLLLAGTLHHPSRAFFTRPTGCSPTSHILPALPPACWVLARIWGRDVGISRWGRAERGWDCNRHVSSLTTSHLYCELTCRPIFTLTTYVHPAHACSLVAHLSRLSRAQVSPCPTSSCPARIERRSNGVCRIVRDGVFLVPELRVISREGVSFFSSFRVDRVVECGTLAMLHVIDAFMLEAVHNCTRDMGTCVVQSRRRTRPYIERPAGFIMSVAFTTDKCQYCEPLIS